MKKTEIYRLDSPDRENLTVSGYSFGHGKKAACIVGSIRGNEVQQLYVCSQIIRKLEELISVRTAAGGIYRRLCHPGDEVRMGTPLAEIVHPYYSGLIHPCHSRGKLL